MATLRWIQRGLRFCLMLLDTLCLQVFPIQQHLRLPKEMHQPTHPLWLGVLMRNLQSPKSCKIVGLNRLVWIMYIRYTCRVHNLITFWAVFFWLWGLQGTPQWPLQPSSSSNDWRCVFRLWFRAPLSDIRAPCPPPVGPMNLCSTASDKTTTTMKYGTTTSNSSKLARSVVTQLCQCQLTLF